MLLLNIAIWVYVLGALAMSIGGLWAVRSMEKSIEAQDDNADEAERIMAPLVAISSRYGITVKGIMVLSALLWPVTAAKKSF